MIILRIKEVVPIMRDDEIGNQILSILFLSLIDYLLAKFWHDDVPIVRGQNKTIRRTDVNNLVNMWKTMTSSGSSSLPPENNNEETKSNVEIPEHRYRDQSQIILARKLRNLQEFATAYDLNLSNSDDILLKTDTARKNVQRMAHDLLTSINEANEINFGSFVAQINGRLLTRSRIQTFYQELLDVMPSKWKEIFQQQSH